MLSVCYTTCIMEIGCGRFDLAFRINHFKNIAATPGVQFVVYACGDTFLQVQEGLAEFKNVQVVLKWMRDFDLYPVFQNPALSMPQSQNPEKDSKQYLTLMNLKLAMIAETMKRFEARNYGWVDFSITYICPDSAPEVRSRLQRLGEAVYDTILVPGCTPANPAVSLDRPCWRFCGGFFVGDARSVTHFHDLFHAHAPIILQAHNRLLWEVNIWAILERDYGWKPTWVQANHDLSIFPLLL